MSRTIDWTFEAQRIRDDGTDSGYRIGSELLGGLDREQKALAKVRELAEVGYPGADRLMAAARDYAGAQVYGQLSRKVIQLVQAFKDNYPGGLTEETQAKVDEHGVVIVVLAYALTTFHRELLQDPRHSTDAASNLADATRREAIVRLLSHDAPYYMHMTVEQALALAPTFTEVLELTK